MPLDRLHEALAADLAERGGRGILKGEESVITAVVPGDGRLGPRYKLAGHGEQLFLKMNSNNYLGMSLRPELAAAEEAACHAFGVGPGAVRFISGTYRHHTELEER